MKIVYFEAGVDSLENCLELLRGSGRRHLSAAVLLGFHAVSCFLKAIMQTNNLQVMNGKKSKQFPDLVRAVKNLRLLSSSENKALTALCELRNEVEHGEVNFNKNQFRVTLHGVFPIIERILRDGQDTDLQSVLSQEGWNVLLEIEEFTSHREKVLDEIVEQALAIPPGKDGLSDPAEAVECPSCGLWGLPWGGQGIEKVRCLYCGEESCVNSCEICHNGLVVDPEDDEPQFHDECVSDWMRRND